MAVTMDQIKELRQSTGAGVLDCKKALEQTDGDMEKAAEILREKGLLAAAKKADRQAAEGRVEVYIHPGNKLVGVVVLNCETDFVARTEGFTALAHDIAMQVAAVAPRWISRTMFPTMCWPRKRPPTQTTSRASLLRWWNVSSRASWPSSTSRTACWISLVLRMTPRRSISWSRSTSRVSARTSWSAASSE